jgi:GT2 family glycosyltransferase
MKASVIVLSWNGRADLPECLAALAAQEFADWELLVVDNGSTDGSAEYVQEQYPRVRLIRNQDNLGFAAGNNRGLRAATGDVLVLLNQDTVVHPGWLQALADAFEADPRCGIAGAKALYPDGRIQHAGGYVDARGKASHFGYREPDSGQFDEQREVDFVTGAALAISRAALEEIGPLDERFHLAYYEDVDWCYRAHEANYRVLYAPKAVLVHKERSTSSDGGHDSVYHFHCNRLRFVFKHWPVKSLREEFVALERAWLEGLPAGDERLVAAMQHAYLYHLLHLEDLVTSRQKVLQASSDDADTLAHVLLALRTVLPLRLSQDTAGPRPGDEAWSDLLAELRQREAIVEQPARSALPIFGPLLTALRRPWNQAITAAYVLPMIHQQIEFNTLVVTLLERLSEGRLGDVDRLGTVLLEYVREANRELGELAVEVRSLRALVEKERSQD